MVPQDLHIHTTWSTGDDAVVPEQTIGLIARVRHAEVIGISDHLIGSDAHQPNWLNQSVARYVASELGIREKLLFSDG